MNDKRQIEARISDGETRTYIPQFAFRNPHFLLWNTPAELVFDVDADYLIE